MRVTVDIAPGSGDELSLHIVGRDSDPRKVKWRADRRLLVAADTEITDLEATELADAVEHCEADCDPDEAVKKLQRYGERLFDAAFGHDLWQEILQAAVDAGTGYLEVAIRGRADGDHAALQGLRWEALHDHYGFITAHGTAQRAEGRNIPMEAGVIRLIGPVAPVAEDAVFREIEHIPRVLFAIGSHLTDAGVRPGAEFMGIMRHLDRKGGLVQPRVLDRATRSGLEEELRTFKPDVVHLIAHGEWHSDRQGAGGQVMVRLRAEPKGEDWVSAEDLLGIFRQAGHWPAMVVLSACQTASAGGRVSALPFAARLVSGSVVGAGVVTGVPVVVAMAGDITDTTCRVFTQAMTAAIGQHVPFWQAVIQGRRAAFFGGHALDSADWALPALFLAEHVEPNAHLVNPARAETARLRIQKLGMAFDHPVFCGRPEFLTRFDRLLDGGDALNVMVAYTPHERKSFGGYRLLKELGARAVRSGVLPVLLGRFERDSRPQDLEGLARAFRNCLVEMRAQVPGFRQGTWSSRALAAAEEGAGRFELAQAIREDLDALVADLAEDDAVRQRSPGQPRAVLLCHRVDKWGVLGDLIDMLDAPGLKGGHQPVPVVLTGADVRQFKHARTSRWTGPSWVTCRPLDRFSVQDEEDILAYLWWLLDPKDDGPVYALSRTVQPQWSGLLRQYLADTGAPVFPGDRLYEWAKKAVDLFFTTGDDEKLRDGYARYFR